MTQPVATCKSSELPIFVESGITVMLFLLLILVQSGGHLTPLSRQPVSHLQTSTNAQPPLRTSQIVP
jgi:hypothetical protein